MNTAGDIREVLQSNIDGLAQIPHILILLSGSVLLLIVGLFLQRKWVIGCLYTLVLLLALSFIPFDQQALFKGQIVNSPLASGIQIISIATAILLLVFPKFLRRPMEFHFLILAMLIASLLMTVAQHLLLIYLSVELASLAGYIITSFCFDKKAFEGAFKYLLIGLVSSAFMIYGISLLYGTNETLLLQEISLEGNVALIAAALFLLGILFKVSVFPMHIWVPNVYQSAPTDAVAFMSIVPKICAFVLLGNVAKSLNNPIINELVIVFAIITIIIGTFAALVQQETKRLIAYGAIAHSGFLLPLLVVNTDNSGPFFFYAFVYAIMNMAIFHFLSIHEKNNQVLLEDLSGLGRKFGLVGGASIVILIALVGLPPTAGFSIKLALFSEVWQAYFASPTPTLMTFFIVGVLSSAIALFYYLRIPYFYFLKESLDTDLSIPKTHIWITTFFALTLLWFFLDPDILDNFALTISKP